MRWRPAILLLAATMLSGCGVGCYNREPWSVRWTEPGLYESLQTADLSPSFSRAFAGAWGLALTRPPTAAASNGTTLQWLDWMDFSEFEGEHFWVQPRESGAPRIGAYFERDIERPKAEAWFREFATQVFDVDAAHIDELGRRFAAARSSGPGYANYELSVSEPPLDVDGLLGRLEDQAPPTKEASERGPGHVVLRTAGWRFELGLPTWTVSNGSVSIRADAADQASLDGLPGAQPDAARARSEAKAAFAAAGLPPPDLPTPHVTSTVRMCVD